MSDTEIEIDNESANKYGGVTFDNSPNATSLSMVFSNVDWSKGTLIKDEWANTLAIDVTQDGYRYSARAKFSPDPDSSYANLWDIAFMIEGEIVLEWSSTYWAVYLNSEETEFSHRGDYYYPGSNPYDDTDRLLGGDETLQFLLTGDNTQIFEVLFSMDNTFILGDGNDVIYGYDGKDIIYGNGGNDRIDAGHSTYDMRDGNRVTTYVHVDEIYGGDGDDVITVYSYEKVDGGSGNDTIHGDYGWHGQDYIKGGDGDDLFHNLRGYISGGDGQDTVTHWRDSKNYALSKSPSNDVMTITYYSGTVYTVAESVESFQFRDITISTEDLIYTGGYSPVVSTSVDPVYRFYNTRDKAFFYTASADERDYVIQNSTPTYTVSDWSEAETIILHRYVTNFGSTYHLTERSEDLDGYSDVTYEGTVVLWDYSSVQFNYTALEAYETIFMPDNIGTDISWPYVYQGSTFEAAHTFLDSDKLAPVHRFYNYETGHHFFTISDAEAEMIAEKSISGEWPFNYEGTRFSVYSADPSYYNIEVPVYRFYSPTLNRHFFTADTQEANLIRLTGVWNDEGIAFWGEALG